MATKSKSVSSKALQKRVTAQQKRLKKLESKFTKAFRSGKTKTKSKNKSKRCPKGYRRNPKSKRCKRV